MQERHDDEFRIHRFSPYRLFIERVSAYWVSIWRCWRTVLDWTVWLYIFIPGILIFSGMYRDVLRNPPEWLFEIPITILLALLGLLQLSGKLRTFAEPGDGLFLHRNVKWVRGMTKAGFVYGLVIRSVISSVFIAIIAPLLLHIFNMTAVYVSALIIYSVVCGFLWMMISDQVMRMWRGWQRTLVFLTARSIFMVVFVWIATIGEHRVVILVGVSVLVIVVASWLMRLRIRTKGTLLHEISVENAAYVASVGWILRDTMEKKPVPRLRRPMLFKQSQPLVRHRDDTYRLLDSWFKSILRRYDLLKPLLYFTGFGSAAVLLPPFIVAVIIWLVLPLLLLSSLQRQWEQWLSEPFIALFKWRDDLLEEASKKAKVWSALPTVTLWAIIIGVKSGLGYGGMGWLAIVIVPIAGYFWLTFINDILSSFSAIRRKKE
ncbi:ABC transporter permease [Cohnella sp. WQ 127256]|uniref:ABC transporter permease n=1 Tax=Cohnella sp. WQ 127256 TaxID=2938790 RepID=UPI002117E501|nr:ABC transporter permease [Cohnella sp. WQ 127256]